MTKMFEEYFRQRSDIVEASQTPRVVVFNQQGYSRAMREADKEGNHFNMNPGVDGRTYCGLPYLIDHQQDAELVVTHEFPYQVQERIRSQRPHRQNAITVKLDGIMSGPPVAEIIASNLTAAQLCDIARAWLDSDDATHWGDFEKGLDELITKHGRFE